MLRVSGLRCFPHAALEIRPGLARVCRDPASGKALLLKAIFLLGRDRSLRMRNSEWIYGMDRTTGESLGVARRSGHPSA